MSDRVLEWGSPAPGWNQKQALDAPLRVGETYELVYDVIGPLTLIPGAEELYVTGCLAELERGGEVQVKYWALDKVGKRLIVDVQVLRPPVSLAALPVVAVTLLSLVGLIASIFALYKLSIKVAYLKLAPDLDPAAGESLNRGLVIAVALAAIVAAVRIWGRGG